ncbi:MAG: right-handed parallel beta-helix repeat-containing protein, partial [Chloroflexia bacterium]
MGDVDYVPWLNAAPPTGVGFAPVTTTSPPGSYSSIQGGVNGSNPGGQIIAVAGVFSETVSVNKSVILKGAQQGVDARTGRTNPAQETILGKDTGGFTVVGQNNVTIDGFTVRDANNPASTKGIFINGGSGFTIVNNIVQNNPQGLFFSSDGTNLTLIQHNRFVDNNQGGDQGGAGVFGGSGPTNNTLINENLFSQHSSSGITIVPSTPATNLVISNNTSTNDSSFVALFTSNGTQVLSNTVTGATGSAIYIGGADTNTVVRANTITGGAATALRVANDFGTGVNSNITATQNILTGNLYGARISSNSLSGSLMIFNNDLSGNTDPTASGVRNDSAITVNASGNWWGTNTPAGVSSKKSGPVDYTPWLHVGTDTQPGTTGFQGDFSYLHADDTSPQTGSTGRIQEAENLLPASGGTIKAEAGTYEEQVDISKPTDLMGAGQGSTTIQSPPTLETKFTSSNPHKPVVYVHNNTGVTKIEQLTVDGLGRGNANNRMDGVAYHSAAGTTDDVTITRIRNNPLDGSQAGVAVYVFNEDGTAR